MNVTRMMVGLLVMTVTLACGNGCGVAPKRDAIKTFTPQQRLFMKKHPIGKLGVVKKYHGGKKTLIQRCYPQTVAPGYSGWIEWQGKAKDGRELKLLLVNCYSV